LLVACSKSEPPGSAGAASAKAGAPAPSASVPDDAVARRRGKACEMVTQEAMSTILGGAVIAKPNDRSNGQTECIYTAVSGISPYAELKVEWGQGQAAMMGFGMANKAEPGITSPLEGLGDQAAQIGPALMIRSGEDLVTIVFSGVDEALPKARKIFDMTKARL
jgi:hypothetical protein